MSEIQNYQIPLYSQSTDTPLEINQTYYDNQNTGVKSIYKTPKKAYKYFICTIGVITGIIFYSIFTYVYITQKDEKIFLGFAFITIWMIGMIGFSGFTPIYIESIVDPVKGTITNKIKKLCCCFSKINIYQISEIKKIIIKKDESVNYNNNYENKVDAFKVEFLFQNNQIETILSGVIDKDNESRIAYNVFINATSNVQYLNQTDEDSMEIQNVQNLNDIPHKLIKQINSNEFYIKNITNKCFSFSLILGSAVFLSFFIIALLKFLHGGIIFGICLTGYIFCYSIYCLIFEIDSLTFYLEQDHIRIKINRNCCCLQKNIILKHGDIQRFDIKLNEYSESQSIFYINNLGKKKYLICLDFYGNEATYLINVLNKYMMIS